MELNKIEQPIYDEYQKWVLEGISKNVLAEKVQMQELWALAGLSAELGEVAELFEKSFRKDLPMDYELVLDECGDVLWYLVALLTLSGLSFRECMEHNISKLNERRYGKVS